MESIKTWFSPKKGKELQRNTKSEHRVDSLPESFSSTQEARVCRGRRNVICASTTNFEPRTQGREATIAYLESGATSDLSWLLSERDRAERLVSQGPKTKATQEVLDIIRKPSIKSVEKFNRVYMQAEMLMKYGIAGEIVYNYSRPLSWNKANVSKLSSMQLRNLNAVMKVTDRFSSDTSSIPRSPPTPIDWVDLGASRTTTFRDDSQLSIVSEPGGWRDLPLSPSVQDDNLADEWAVEEAQIVTVTRVPLKEAHIVKCESRQSE
ncbi:hypothetical protein F5B19DRAFT_224137 [Rostrohypoxylon terebratum]|nr:hypothetical protein F5B19DRAFT_224137 [Rostrohypoxylon terebratum]